MTKIEKRNWIALAAFVAMRLAQPSAAQDSSGGFVPPEGWMPPTLDPAGVQLETRELGPGVYALLSNRPPVDNSGFVVGESGVLVIDAHFNMILDGDHSDYPEDLGVILAPILDERADFVIGSRVAAAESGALHWNQRLGNALACNLIRAPNSLPSSPARTWNTMETPSNRDARRRASR